VKESKEAIANPAEWVTNCIADYTRGPDNTLQNGANEPAWGEPLIGFAAGDDPLWETLKKDIGSFFWTPIEIFVRTFPSVAVKPNELTVISWVLPQTAQTRRDHRKEKTYPSERWARSRKFGEDFNVKLRIHLVAQFAARGLEAVAPQISPFWEQKVSERYALSSTWSERHAAYVAGLGTFGLCDGLITPVGKAMRSGSVVARIGIPSTARPYEDHHAYCLFYSKGTCGKCIDRCPAGALTRQGHDKLKCREYVGVKMRDYVGRQFGFEAYGCGLCQTGVPCESRIPKM
jgi:epoxyqueuosine reductase